MDLRTYLHAIRKNWRAVFVFTLLGLGTATVMVVRATPQYESTVTFFVTTSATSTSGSVLQGDQFGQERVNSYAKLLPSERLAAMVVRDAGLGLTPRQVMAKISAT